LDNTADPATKLECRRTWDEKDRYGLQLGDRCILSLPRDEKFSIVCHVDYWTVRLREGLVDGLADNFRRGAMSGHDIFDGYIGGVEVELDHEAGQAAWVIGLRRWPR
jgi:hypothetical protein